MSNAMIKLILVVGKTQEALGTVSVVSPVAC